MTELDRRLTAIVPETRQLKLQQTEFYAFVHFTINTYTGREWGDGAESPSLFDPVRFDPDQWVRAVKSAGMKGIILTCKHHDGFCLWPSRYTAHTVAASPWKSGKGDIVREVSDACRRGGIKFGVYLSPWDRNQPCYGSGGEYDDYFVNQLTELLTQYGDIFCVWFDGACGEGKNGRKQVYDWDRYYEVVRKLQPEACINVCGPDIRWCGNEAGETRDCEWSVVPARTRDTERIAGNSQQSDEAEFRQRKIKAQDRDLGSREVLQNERELVWYPAEVNTSIRPGWFYHPEEDGRGKSVEELFNVYLHSVGGNATFLLNIPPTPAGLFHPTDVKRLKELGERIRDAFSDNLLEGAALSADFQEPGHEIDRARADSYDGWYQPPEGKTACAVRVTFPEKRKVSYVVLKENIKLSQRIERFSILDGEAKPLYRGAVVGYKKIARLPHPVLTDKLTIQIEDSRLFPTLSFLGVF